MPEVSVLVPAFKPDWLDTCIASALAQTFADFELLIGDDSDGDAIESAVSKWDDPRIRYGRNPRKQQPGANRDFLLGQANGRYVKFLFDDDMLLPHSLELLKTAMETYRTKIAFHGRYIIDAVGKVRDEQMTLPEGAVGTMLPHAVLEGLVLGATNFIGEPSNVMLDAETLHSMPNPFGIDDLRMRCLTDVALYTNFAATGHVFAAIGHRASAFRKHGAQNSDEQSPLHSAGLFEFELFMRWTADQGQISGEECRAALLRRRDLYASVLATYPELGAFVALGSDPDESGRFLTAAFYDALATGWSAVASRRAAA